MLDRIGTLLLVGGGRMGEALLAGWCGNGLAAEVVHVVEPDVARGEALASRLGVAVVAAPAQLPPDLRPDVLVIAVKPQVLGDVLPEYRRFHAALVLSIVAGKPLALFSGVLGDGAPVVRAMPNTPAAVGRGVSVLCAGPACDGRHRGVAEALMTAVGDTWWIDDEGQMHGVTAVSGSGPAYVFHLIEALAAAGARAGLPGELAMALARGTVTGAAELAYRAPEQPAERLRHDVTSPGGTTAAALEVLMAADGLTPLMMRAVAAAADRSRALA